MNSIIVNVRVVVAAATEGDKFIVNVNAHGVKLYCLRLRNYNKFMSSRYDTP